MLWPQVRDLLKDLFAPRGKRSGLLDTAFLALLAGVVWRAVFIFHVHPLQSYIYSDMQSYLDEALRFYNRYTVINPGDSIYPPGASLLFGLVFHLTNSWFWVSALQFVLSAGAPVLIFLIALLLYNRSVALISLIFSSLYIAFIEFSGFLLSETAYTFFMLLSFLLLVIALKSKLPKKVVLWGILAGVGLGWTASIKTTVLASAFCAAVVLIILYIRKKQKNLPLVLLGVLIGAVPTVVGLSLRCTDINQGQFCLISSNGPMDALQGHYGRVGHFNYVDNGRGLSYAFGNPTSLQKGFNGEISLPFGPYDTSKNLGLAKSWSRAHPKEAFELSMHHIYDLFSTIPWPPANTTGRSRIIISERLFRIFILLPSLLYIAVLALPSQRRKIRGKGFDLLVLAPIIGLFIVVFLTIGEPRYRIPYDAFLIILAARAYVFGWAEYSAFNSRKNKK